MINERKILNLKQYHSRSYENTYYKKVDGINLPMKIFYPENHKSSDRRAAVICIHGGAWGAVKDNSPWDGGIMSYQAEYFASRGAVGVSISYRNFIQPDVERNPGEKYPELADLYSDCRDAVAYLRKNSERFGIDSNKIAAIGDSAGGHLAACLAAIDNADGIGKVNAVIACNPIMDLTDPKWIKYIECNSMERVEERAKSISPFWCVKDDCVPMLVMHGLKDDCVCPEHSIRFCDKMKKLGARCDIKLFPDAKHAFIIVDYTATDKQISDAMYEADDFLVSVGFLKSC
ncbi:MAG: alpha/beta hydrolase [Clostridia bacterium]|nr:alpha/beta hydrolase [Clostridia bacterium]